MRFGTTIAMRIGVIAALFAAGAVLSPFDMSLLTTALIYAIFACSLDLLMGYTGLPSLGHAAYFGIGGYVIGLGVAKFTTVGAVGLVLAAGGGAVFAGFTSWFAVRARAVYYLMLTFAFAQLLLQFVEARDDLTGGDNGVTDIPSFTLFPGAQGDAFNGQQAFYFYTVVVFLFCYYIMRRLVNSPFGRSLQGIRENEARMLAFGYNVLAYKVVACMLAGAFGALAGGLAAEYERTVFPSALAINISIIVLIIVMVGGAGTLFGSVVGAILYVYVQDQLSSRFDRWEAILGLLFVLSVYFLPKGIAGGLTTAATRAGPIGERLISRGLARLKHVPKRAVPQLHPPGPIATLVHRVVSDTSELHQPGSDTSAPKANSPRMLSDLSSAAPVLELHGVTKAFGALVALADVSFAVKQGERVALIGPNGAGKTTLVDVVTGRTRATRGRIRFRGRDVTRTAQHHRAQLGLARTFQRSTVFEALSTFDNVSLAVQQAGGVAAHCIRDARGIRDVNLKTDELLAAVHLSGAASVRAAELSHGERRQLEIAMGLATSPSVLLLDEPSAGLSPAETRALVGLLKSLPSSLTFLVVEHDMDLVFGVASRLVILQTGRVIADGEPERIAESPEAREAYLGAAWTPIAVR